MSACVHVFVHVLVVGWSSRAHWGPAGRLPSGFNWCQVLEITCCFVHRFQKNADTHTLAHSLTHTRLKCRQQMLTKRRWYFMDSNVCLFKTLGTSFSYWVAVPFVQSLKSLFLSFMHVFLHLLCDWWDLFTLSQISLRFCTSRVYVCVSVGAVVL